MASLFEEAPGERNFGVVLLGDRTAGVTLRRLMESLPAEKRSSLVRKDGGHEDSDLLSFDYAPAVPPEIKQPRFFFFALDCHEEPTAEAVETLLYRPTHTVGFLPAMDGRDAARLASVRALHSRFSFPEIPLVALIDQASARTPSAEVAKALSLEDDGARCFEFSRDDLKSCREASLLLVNSSFKSGIL